MFLPTRRVGGNEAAKHGDCRNQIVRADTIRASAGTPMAVVFASIGYCSCPAFTTNCLSGLRSLARDVKALFRTTGKAALNLDCPESVAGNLQQ